LEELSIMGMMPTQGWAWVRRRQSSTMGLVFDIEVCDDAGRVAVRLHGLNTRQLSTDGDQTQTVLLTPSWKEEEIISVQPAHPVPNPAIEERIMAIGDEAAVVPQALGTIPTTPSLVLLCDLPSIEAPHLQSQMASGGFCRSLYSSQPSRDERFQDIVVQLIQELQHLWGKPTGYSEPARPMLVQVVVAHREEPSFLEALAGVLKTAMQEHSKLQAQLIEVDGEPEEGELLSRLQENQHPISQDLHIRYRDGRRWTAQWQELYTGELASPTSSISPTSPPNIPWKEGGCYLITGGAGGLARLFVQEIAQQVQKATVILAGRSALTTSQRAQLDKAARAQDASGGLHIDYQQVDVSDGLAVHALIQRVQVQYGHLDGIIHAAGVLRDCLLLNKTSQEVQTVLAPKVIGVEQLDKASAELPLDFFILCSSFSAIAGNVGQADYAAANAYLDAFAHTRRAQVTAGQRHGNTISINWPFWKEGGMQIDESKKQLLRDLLGVEPMETEAGMKALYQALAFGLAQVIVLHGQAKRIKQRFLRQSPELPVETASIPDNTDVDRESWQDNLCETLLHMTSDWLKVPTEQIDAETPLTDYGFDSITFTGFANRLNHIYQLDLTPAVFFEHATIERLAQYLQTTYAATLASHFTATSAEVTAQQTAAPEPLIADELLPAKISQPNTRITREAVSGNRLLFLKISQ
jgi:NAD(P)-dependent dehydrogenase (short-subunit alcohol dehydrogenase family)